LEGSGGVRRGIAPGVFDDQQRRRAHERVGGGQRLEQFRGAVRRVDENDVERGPRKTPPRAFEPHADDSMPVGHAAGGEILRDEIGGARIALDKRDVRGAAAQCLDADRAGSRAGVEEPRAAHRGTEHVEQRLAQLV